MSAWMSAWTLPRRAARRAVAGATAALMTVSLGAAAGPAAADHTNGPAGPVHAGNTYGWYYDGGLVYDETFVGPLAGRWDVEGRGVVQNQNGMLTLNTAGRGTVSATLMRPGQAYGRWETRLRQRQYGRGNTPYRVLTELVPVTAKSEGCGEQNIALNRFTMGRDELDVYVRTRPDRLYQSSMRRSFGQDQWHTFAVEVTPKRISWFVDAHVVRTETRPKALSGRKFQVRFTMLAAKGERMNKARMQMDWLRYWTLHAKNARSTQAPRLTKSTYGGSCAAGR
ncbi:MAG: hypothetical protein AVDCRST_MAG32-3042 [uncultured Nocardioides sp.]|uniref:GH16 domain-containing protein n=1 Tax=uncultured Nocardioides sp. TaxID=198441 RepID=A0A6J4P0C6_9ACTN|nr:MAG: hypothetical protein AVDCRST_MAG32-3042 [uncultured Nocardioides sp.]